MQVLRALAQRVVTSEASLSVRVGLLVHLVRKVLYVLLAILTISYPLTTFSLIDPYFRYSVASDAALFGAIIVSIATYLVQGQRLAGRGLLRGAALVPFAIACSVGMSFTYSAAMVRGLFHTNEVFERTPKFGGSSKVRAERRYRPRIELAAFLEVVIGVAYVAFAAHTVFVMHLYAHGAFMIFVALSYLWVGAMGVSAIVQMLGAAKSTSAHGGAEKTAATSPDPLGRLGQGAVDHLPLPAELPRATSSPPR